MENKPKINLTFQGQTCHRWQLALLEAVADKNVEKFEICLKCSHVNLNTQVHCNSLGAAFDFDGFGFFDIQSSEYAEPLFDINIYEGDTVLHICLRHQDPRLAFILIQHGVDFRLQNSKEESALSFLYEIKSDYNEIIQQTRQPTNEIENNYLKLVKQYQQLFHHLENELKEYQRQYRQIVANEMKRIYLKYNPSRIEKIESQLDSFIGTEFKLLKLIKEKYDE